MIEMRRGTEPRGRFVRRPVDTMANRPGGKPFFRDNNSPKPSQKKVFRRPEIKITNDMQVTDGKHKGIQMLSTASPKVRPTARRVREALFKSLGRRTRFARFLDLCAGSGAVGIEALSRGALLCTFVERSAKMCHFIKKNLESCEICAGHGDVLMLEAVPFLKRMEMRRRQWDVVYFDPPYEANYDEVLEFFARGVAIRQGGVLVIEHHAEMFFPPKIGKLNRRRVVREGDTALSFYERGR